ncbi:hypothetical protein HJC23_005289 [Cyclotella cryptica]|uniref:Uncharacterized protein n=1 Tax=Cyclotella cryptica TaxID=29204 RepID=A0ABD3P5B1_9STRA|eukprot:CCRYP_017748-RA/>CCRYP_017748-RA protein AED:0.01 eAED:0.01 QI:0/-1/0/1/-1/1/1/0/101
MIRRSLGVMSNKGSRKIIRDPRKTKQAREQIRSAVVVQDDKQYTIQQQQKQQSHEVSQPRMAFEPSAQNHQSLGIGSYMLAGAGVALGFTLVGAIFGALGG